jgi:hypothetical protein
MPIDERPLIAYAAIEPCIMLGCIHEYGHDGKHEYCDSESLCDCEASVCDTHETGCAATLP